MILYNVTVKIDKRVEEEWLDWMKNQHIPDVLNTGLINDHKICELMHDDEDGGATYAFQYYLDSMENFEKYQNDHAPALQKEHADKYQNKYVAFRTIMKIH